MESLCKGFKISTLEREKFMTVTVLADTNFPLKQGVSEMPSLIPGTGRIVFSATAYSPT
jgi:hypothetical protein